MKKKDISGMEFENLVALRPTDQRINRSVAWIVRCKTCGKEQLAGCDQLLRKRHTQCIYCKLEPRIARRIV